MKSSVVALSVLLLAASRFIVIAQGRTATEYFTRGMVNGRFWESIPDAGKTLYLEGARDGQWGMLDLLLNRSSPLADSCQNAVKKAFDTFQVSGFKVKDYLIEVDEFYREKANITIPVMSTLTFISVKFRGWSKADLDAYVENLRKMYNDN